MRFQDGFFPLFRLSGMGKNLGILGNFLEMDFWGKKGGTSVGLGGENPDLGKAGEGSGGNFLGIIPGFFHLIPKIWGFYPGLGSLGIIPA